MTTRQRAVWQQQFGERLPPLGWLGRMLALMLAMFILLGGAAVILQRHWREVEIASAATITWDGGGTDGTCGGNAGDGNKWSCGANWSTDAAPGVNDVATFDGTSDKDATIDVAISVQGLALLAGYDGTLSQAAAMTLGSAGFVQASGVFIGGSQTIEIESGSLTLEAAADFTATSGNLLVEQDLTLHADATFAAASGTITITGSSGADDSVLSCGGHALATLIFNATDSGADVLFGSDCTHDFGNAPTFSVGELTNEGSITVGTGTWTVNGSYIQSAAGASTTFAGTVWEIMDKASAPEVPGSLVLTGGTLTATGLTAITLEGSLDNSGDLLPTGVALTLIGSESTDDSVVTCSGNEDFAAITVNKSHTTSETRLECSVTVTGDFTRSDGPVVNSSAAQILSVEGDFDLATTDAFGGSNLQVRLAGGNDQTLTQQAASTFASPIRVDKSGNTLSLTTALTTTAGCEVGEGRLNLAGYVLTCSNAPTIEAGGVLILQGAENQPEPTLQSGSTVIYNGDGDSAADSFALKAWDYYHLTIDLTDAGDEVDASGLATVTLGGDFSLQSGEFLAPATLAVTGNWSHTAGIFSHSSGTVDLIGAGQQIAGDTTFYHLTKTETVTETLTIEAGSTQTIQGTLTLSGAVNNLLALRSTVTNTAWEIDPQGTRTIAYLDVKDSHNINPTVIQTGYLSITNSGGNTGWNFDPPPSIPGVPTLSIPNYGQLRVVVSENGNDAGVEYAIALSTDDFIGDTQYIQSDFTLGATLSEEDWLTFAEWGGAAGVVVTGLANETTYYVKAKARDGVESSYSLTANTATWVKPSLTITVEGTALGSVDLTGYSDEISFGFLVPGVAATAVQKIAVTTNATSGYRVEVMAEQKMKLTTAEGVDVDHVVNGSVGTNAAPVAWQAPTGTTIGEDTAFIGYHTSDAVLGSGVIDRFANANTWAGFAALGQFYEVLYHSGPTSGEDNGEEFVHLTYKIETSNIHPSGNYDSLQVKYRVVPLY